MPKKRPPRITHIHTPRRKGTRNFQDISESSGHDILSFLYQSGTPATLNDLLEELPAGPPAKKDVESALEALLQDGLIVKSGKRQFTLGKHAPLYEGILEHNPRGFGFASHCTGNIDAPPLLRDPFIPASRMKSAHQGDRILIRVHGPGNKERPEATVIKVLARGTERLAGFFSRDNRGARVIPEDIRYPFTILVEADAYPELRNGDAVIASIDESDPAARNVRGKIIEILGSPENIDVQMRLVIEKFRLPHVFSPESDAEAAALPEEISAEEGREDLRDVLHVTIDGETAKDFDDAVAVVKTKKGYRLYVSIADVSFFVPIGSAIDRDAYERGTSIYFPGRVIPMLPEKLSNNLCSLVPDRDRLTLTAILDFDRAGDLLNKRFVRSIIRSRQRFTYTMVRKILVDNDKETRDSHKSFLTPLKWAGELARLLEQKRRNRGAIGFTLPEAEISLDDDGRIQSIKRAERNFAHQIIEDFMLAANEAVASTFTEQKRAALYRIHERPDPEKVREFSVFARTLGLQLPEVENSPHWFARVLELCVGSPKEYIVNNLLLRTMQQARYSPENPGHFGLSATDYTHFTSPIRRYPDLMVHRELCRMFSQKKQQPKKELPALKDAGDFLSGRERAAVNAEREMNDRLKLLFMEKHIGESFEAVISGVSDSFLYVELLELFVSGAVAVGEITGDYFFYDARHHRLSGEISRKIYQLGDVIRVTMLEVDRTRNRINFKLFADKNG
jgi:ribonuclease R